MEATKHFKQVVQINRSTFTDGHFERNAGLIFEKETNKVKIEVRCRFRPDLLSYSQGEGSSTALPNTECPAPRDTEAGTSSSEFAQAAAGCEASGHSQAPLVINLDPNRLRPFIQVRRRNCY